MNCQRPGYRPCVACGQEVQMGRMTTTEQIPKMDVELAKLDKQIERHINRKQKLTRLFRRIIGMIEYRERRIRELGCEKSRIATFELDMVVPEKPQKVEATD